MKKTVGLAVGAIVATVAVYLLVQMVLVSWTAEQNREALISIDLRIAKQELLLTTIADLVRRSDADEVTKRIVVDCQADERKEFDALLDRLSLQLSQAELRRLDTLFYKCGSFYADRKAVMSARLAREVEVYNDYLSLRQSLLKGDQDTSAANRALLWSKLADSEQLVADHFNSLVKLQGDIITALLDGDGQDPGSIAETLVAVKETRDQMTILSRQIENFRNEIQSL